MAYIIFSGGHSLGVDAPADNVEQTLTGSTGAVSNEWTQFVSGSSIVRVNPATVAYIVEDQDYEDTFRSPGQE
jgi:hypothetical protein